MWGIHINLPLRLSCPIENLFPSFFFASFSSFSKKWLTTISNEFSCPIDPARLFKAAILDAHNLLPKIVPDKIKSIEIQGDDGAGSIKRINLADDGPFDFIKHRIDEVDEQNFKCKFSLIEGAVVGEKIEKVVDTVQFVASADGGSIIKATSEFYTTGDYTMGEDEIQMGKDMAVGTFKVVEGYLLQNPDAYA
ncbi:major strawberry allergen Fra a 1.07-like [Macadamia integrifolia]|uniref:major strawberry allergen Fra a 1.07-like n=1 Tax=Macadamia integrifolia TaxID=60698 RepID=UPI001C4E3E11|nr:major strawberry allergen Fra a 1.07-like [Macadamia integrifolia]